MIRVSFAVVITVGAGLVQGAWTNRWHCLRNWPRSAPGLNPYPW